MAGSEKYPIVTVYEDVTRPGSWLVRVTFAPGRSVRRRATSAKAAEATGLALAKRETDGLKAVGGDVTLTTFINEWWATANAPRGLAPKTLADDRDTIERYILPILGGVKLKQIDVPMVIGLYHRLVKERSPATAHRALRKLHKVLEAARRWKYIRDNPVPDARKDLPAYAVAERQPLTAEETARLLITVEGHRLADLYHVALTLGLRIGELLGLQWIDIDWQAATLQIRRQAQDIAGKKQLRAATKSSAGTRLLPLPPRLLARLKGRWAQCGDSVFIFTNDEGGMLSPGGFQRHFRGGRSGSTKRDGTDKVIAGMRQKAKLPTYVTAHTFRHTVASRLLDQGVSEELRGMLLGHTKATVTQRYSHAALATLRRAVEALEQDMYRAA